MIETAYFLGWLVTLVGGILIGYSLCEYNNR